MSNVIMKGHRITMDTERFMVKHIIDFSVEIFPEDMENTQVLDIETALELFYAGCKRNLNDNN